MSITLKYGILDKALEFFQACPGKQEDQFLLNLCSNGIAVKNKTLSFSVLAERRGVRDGGEEKSH